MRIRFWVFISVGSFLWLPHIAAAEEKKAPLIAHHSNSWSYQEPMHFHQDSLPIDNKDGTPRETLDLVEIEPPEGQTKEKEFVTKLAQKTDWEDKILSKIPFSKDIQDTYYFIKGDTDIYFKGLRMDMSNTGLSYTTKKTPIIGTHLGLDLEFLAGKENGVKFRTDKIPFIGKTKGFSIKGSATDEDSKIFARYKFDLK